MADGNNRDLTPDGGKFSRDSDARPEEVMTINRTTQPEGERMAQFTPGPWDAGNRTVTVEGADFTPVDAPEMAVAFVPASRGPDAHLIAAAPELYEALEVIMSEFGSDIFDYDSDIHKVASRALTKARGGKA